MKYMNIIKMKATTRELLRQAQIFCDENDKSTEFMLQYMQDVAKVDLDCVIKYLQSSE
jgi:hypothetical protein